MKTFFKLGIAGCVLFIAMFVVSCIPDQESISDAGQTLVKLYPSVYNMLAFDAKLTPQSGVLFEVRRNVPNEADLNSTTTVEVKFDQDTTMLNAYNTKNKTKFIPLPTTLASVSPAISGGKITLTFEAGETGKAIMINVPAAGNFDFSKNYALAFKLLTVSGKGAKSIAANDTIVCEVLAKNKWDGVYTVTGTFVDYINSAWTGYYPKTIELRTTGAMTCSKYDGDLGSFPYGYLFDTDGTGSTLSYFGAFTLGFVFDANDNVTVVNTTNDPLPRGRACEMYTGSDAINKYNSATKSMDVKFYFKQMNVSPVLRGLITEHYEYKGAR